MYMLNVVGELQNADLIAEDILKFAGVKPVDAMQLIDDTSFTIRADDENLEKTLDFNFVVPFGKDNKLESLKQKFEELINCFNFKPDTHNASRLSDETMQSIYESLKKEFDNKISIQQKVETLQSNVEYAEYLLEKDIEISALDNLKNFKYRFGSLNQEGRLKLKKNYENNPAVVIHVANSGKEEIYLAVYPKTIADETNRILRSFGWVDILLPSTQLSTNDYLQQQKAELSKTKVEVGEINDNIERLINTNLQNINNFAYTIELRQKLDNIKAFMAKSNKFYYMAAWVPQNKLESVKQTLEKYNKATIRYKNAEELICISN